MSLIYKILALASLVGVFEVALAIWVGTRLERAALRAEEAVENPAEADLKVSEAPQSFNPSLRQP
jgi:hypothetical protein